VSTNFKTGAKTSEVKNNPQNNLPKVRELKMSEDYQMNIVSSEE